MSDLQEAFAPGEPYNDDLELGENNPSLDFSVPDSREGMTEDEMTRQLSEFFAERDRSYDVPTVPVDETETDIDPDPEPVYQPEPVPDSYKIADREVSREEAEQLLALYDWAAQLPPEAADAVNNVLSGQYRLVPADQPDQAPSAASGSGPAPATFTPGVAGAVVPDTPQLNPNEFLDPQLAQYVQQVTAQQNAVIAQQQQMLANYQEQQQQIAQTQYQQEQQRMLQQVEIGQAEFSEAHPDFTAQEIDLIATQAAALQIVPTLMARNGGNAIAATKEALETAMWATPQFREKVIQSQVDQYAQTVEQTSEKKRKASALAGSSGSVPRTAPAQRPMTKAEREQAMIREVAEAMNGATS
jgi:hypothetical protein